MTAATSASVSDIAKPSMGAMKRRSILIPQSSNHRDKLKDAIKKKAIDEIVELFVEAQQIGKNDTGIIKMILDNMKKRNTNAGEVLDWLLCNQHTLQYKTLLGYFYLHDIGTEIDTRKAYVFYLAAAKKDYPIAQYLLGECYSSGSGTKADEKLAFQWYQKAAEGGCTNGQNWVGYCYEFGKGTEKDNNKAFTYYKKSSRQGNMVGMHFLADCYEKGTGTTKNIDMAIHYYSKAAKLGHEGFL
ncbi:hypothetical protein C2G38_2145218 [Gigaspora rosea]|uniref:HCP-like protein n=1 Tax=Gigaspora rosea TaxID=44941 RepID=A0A397UY21_9GLOM|nr:hypothetical protein C2G38_2145218 [Gigaspora rosea]